MQKQDNEELNMTYSGILYDENNERFVRVRFDRGRGHVEAIVPSGKITSSDGFTKEELSKITEYIIENKEDIMSRAHKISSFMHIFK